MLNSNNNLTSKQIGGINYPETCPTCKEPARAEINWDDKYGHEWWVYCVNPSCINFDGAALREQREALAKKIRNQKQLTLLPQ